MLPRSPFHQKPNEVTARRESKHREVMASKIDNVKVLRPGCPEFEAIAETLSPPPQRERGEDRRHKYWPGEGSSR
jgi:hypothetical protein